MTSYSFHYKGIIYDQRWSKWLNTQRLVNEKDKKRSNSSQTKYQSKVAQTSGQSKQKHRSAFQRDYDRIVFSSPFRRLQGKTQVFPKPENDVIHNRLTHSLEVSCVGRSLGLAFGEILMKQTTLPFKANDIAWVVASACLAHDIGNPPFGHCGEGLIKDFLSDFFLKNPTINLKPEQQMGLCFLKAMRWL